MSVRLLLRLLLLVQAAAALLLAAAAARWLGIGPLPALALGLAMVLAVRLLINANNFVLASRSASPTPDQFRLGPAGWLRLLGGEFAASMLLSSWSMPRAAPCQTIYPDAPGPPVLLLHGYGCNGGYWGALTALLDAARSSHATLDLEPVAGDIDGYVPQVQRAVEQLCAQAGAPQLVIVAHSMGGLAARAWMRDHGTARVARVITLGTPHHGTCLASFGIGRNAAQMRRAGCADGLESAWLRALAASESAAARALVTSIYTHHDNIIAPQTSSILEGARNIAFGGIGHVALGRNRGVLACVMREIGALSWTSAAPKR
jgi:triacylglycerol esterase/lipase EstA (alpha/beta hydrolase family)